MKLEAYGDSWKFSAGKNGESWVLYDTRNVRDLVQFGYGMLNCCSERDALSGKCRFHGKIDGREVIIESEKIYPYGGESVISRVCTLRSRLLEVCVDVKPGKGEIIRNIELEDLFFPGDFKRIEILRTIPEPGEKFELETLELSDNSTWESCSAFAMLLLTDANNNQIELGCGGDWWRNLGVGDTLWQIEKASDGVKVRRRVLMLAADAETERRSWRFNYYIAWGKNIPVDKSLNKNDETVDVDLGNELGVTCFRAPAVRKFIRKTVRRKQEYSNNIVLLLPDVESCDDAGHLERPGKKQLRHWDLDELFALYSWGNRALGGDRVLSIRLPENSLFAKLPSGRYLAREPGESLVREV